MKKILSIYIENESYENSIKKIYHMRMDFLYEKREKGSQLLYHIV